MRITTGRGRTAALLAAVVGTVLVASAADAAKLPRPKCGGRQEMVRVDEKVCPATKRRPAVVIQRACCQKPNGKIRCKAFKKCPRRSPS
ncbi:MAG: hypothetical protein KIT14_08310 [bacterium]|nr:hypothetical protein [bacterium]